jgi:acetate kinase
MLYGQRARPKCRLDALVFTDAIGESEPAIRRLSPQEAKAVAKLAVRARARATKGPRLSILLNSAEGNGKRP